MIYPQVCSLCGKTNKNSLCNKCKILFQKEFYFQTENYIQNTERNFQEHSYFFKYKDLIRSQLISFKFNERPYFYKTISKIIEKNIKSFENLKKYDIIIIVPISKKRKKERGYNQSELIAKEISKMINVPIFKNIIIKTKDTKPQSSLNKEGRKQNVIGVYSLKITPNIPNLKNKKILIFDDIYTTGNTVNECAQKLIDYGVKKENIGVLTVAKD